MEYTSDNEVMGEDEVKGFVNWLRHNHLANMLLNGKATKQNGEIVSAEDILEAWKTGKGYNQLSQKFKIVDKPKPMYPFDPLDPKNYNQE
jgi:hypothetical protein